MDTKSKIKRIITLAIIIIGIVLLMNVVINSTKASTKYDAFAQCLTDNGVKFFGAFWCPHCQAQKKEFGASVKKLPYIECSTPDGKAQNQTCNDAGIKGYPTWEFADGTRVTGEQTLESLSEKSSCPLPTGAADTSGATTQ